MKNLDLSIKTLGTCKIKSPVKLSKTRGDNLVNYVRENEKVLFDVFHNPRKNARKEPLTMELAGPREHIFFDCAKATVAIVTCGGLCPGINNVIRSLVMTLHYRYGVKKILGVRYGYQGFIPEYGHDFMELTPSAVTNIHQFGGTILGSSRGKQDVSSIVDCLERDGVNILFTIGGDGTLTGALAIQEEIEQRGLKIVVAGIPKTIDNDINLIEKTFGFETSFTVASPILRDAHNEAKGAYNGVAIVKLMGRDSGFIAANAALSMPEVNFVLVPEFEFDLEGPKGLFSIVRKRLEEKHHCVIVVAEGAGQHLFDGMEERKDASGNILHDDIGVHLSNALKQYFKRENFDGTVKYIDPSYIIRSAPATPSDSIFCNKLGMHGVHGAMAGKTGFVVGRRNNKFVYLPIKAVVSERKKIDPEGSLWLNVLETTGQPVSMKNEG
ncbi:MAG: ATP-dependent 6-phosphofructokinase [Bacteroidota bacterium]